LEAWRRSAGPSASPRSAPLTEAAPAWRGASGVSPPPLADRHSGIIIAKTETLARSTIRHDHIKRRIFPLL
jgi:hypothetical protein